MNEPALDVLICTYERADTVLDAARDALAQLREGDALLVLDQSRRVQPTRAALAALGDDRIRHVAAPPRGLPAARNRALELSERPLVVFLDDDVRLSAGCLQAHRTALMTDGIGGTVGPIDERGMAWNTPGTACRVGLDGRVRVRLEGERAVDVQSVKGCNMGFRRLALEQAGPFDIGLGGTAFLEETEISERIRRAGWRIRFVPEAHLTHLAAPSGGVRVGSPLQTAWWRFHNTGRFLARHHPERLPLATPTFAAIALKHAMRSADPGVVPRLMGAFAAGCASAARDC